MSQDLSYHTQSLCPRCLKLVEARHVAHGNTVYMEKNCPDHGRFKAKVWEGLDLYQTWRRPKIPIEKRFSMTSVQQGCPFDCGLCPDHRQHTCTAVLDITAQCNLVCPFCFADAGRENAGPDPALGDIQKLMEQVMAVSPACNLQLSGGEPSLRDDLPDIVAAAVSLGFAFVQLNTNGIVAGLNPEFALSMARAGLSSVFLQFDGVTDPVYERLRGRPLLKIKQAAIRHFGENGIGVVLVPTLVPGVNDHDIGRILEFALDHAPAVRGVHFQPVSFFGRHGRAPEDRDRITIPEILESIQAQTGAKFKAGDFTPPSCEHSLCAFSGKFLRGHDGSVRPLTLFDAACCTPVRAELGAQKAKATVVRHWQAPARTCACTSGREDGLDRFIREASQGMFTVSGMAFQDVWNLDIERLKGCCIHAVSPDGRLIPFCAYNLTSADGKGLYRDHG